MSETTVNENKSDKVKKIVRICLNVLFYCIIALLLLFSISNIASRKQEANLKIPSVFGTGYLKVESDSMSPTFNKDDMIYVRVVKDSNRARLTKKLKVGSVITFQYYSESARQYILNTHRIVDIITRDDGSFYFITQGDARANQKDNSGNYIYRYNKETDLVNGALTNEQCEVVSVDDVRGIYRSHVKGGGKVITFLQSQLGFGLCIVLPIFVFVGVEVVLLILQLRDRKQSKQKVSDEERLKEELRRQIEAEMRAQALAEAKAQAENGEEKEENKEVEE